MTEQHLSIETFNEQLQHWIGTTVKVSKDELADEDEAILDLQNVTYQTNTHRLDDYQSMHTLRLNGTGKIENEAHHLQPLPSQVYEIPLEDTSHYTFDGSQFILNTDRGNYTIERLDEA